MQKRRILNFVLIVLAVVFFVAAAVFFGLYAAKPITEFNPIAWDFSQLRYIDLYFWLSIASFAAGILLLAFYAVGKLKKCTGRAFFAAALAVPLAVFCAVSAPSAAAAVQDYSEYAVYTDIEKDDDVPDAKYNKYFPCFDTMRNAADFTPYFSLTQYRIGDSVLRASQIFNDDADPGAKDMAITADYFETDKARLMGKYAGEKAVVEMADEDGSPLPAGAAKEVTYDGLTCFVTILDTEKRLKIAGDDFYFTLTVRDAGNDMQIDEEKLLALGTAQFALLKAPIPFTETNAMV